MYNRRRRRRRGFSISSGGLSRLSAVASGGVCGVSTALCQVTAETDRKRGRSSYEDRLRSPPIARSRRVRVRFRSYTVAEATKHERTPPPAATIPTRRRLTARPNRQSRGPSRKSDPHRALWTTKKSFFLLVSSERERDIIIRLFYWGLVRVSRVSEQDESPSRGPSLNRSQRGNCSTEYSTLPGT